MKRKWYVYLFVFSLLMSGCAKIKPDTPQSGKYATQNRLSAVEYSIYINKQLTVFTNQISTRMGSISNLSKDFNVDNEITLAQNSLDILQETYDETATVYPSEGDDANRDATLVVMMTAIGHLQSYINDLDKKSDVSGYFKDFENDFNSLTGQAGLYNQ